MTLQKGFATQAVQQLYQQVVHSLGSELAALVTSPVEELTARLPAQLAQAILAVRRGEVTIEPGYDGVYGTVSLSQPLTVSDAQASLF